MKTVRSLIRLICIIAIFHSTSTLLSVSRAQTGPRSGRSREITPAQAREQVDLLAKELRDARSVAARVTDKATREKLESILSQAELRARDLSDDLSQVKPAQTQPVLSASELDKLLEGIKKEAFDPGKLAYIENFASKRPLTSAQAAALTKCFNFDENRIKAARVLYPKLIDKENFNDVLSTFVFDGSRSEVRKSVGLK